MRKHGISSTGMQEYNGSKITHRRSSMDMRELILSVESLGELIDTVVSRRQSMRFQVNGLSMVPFIKDNDIITISPFVRRGILLGMPVVFVNPVCKKLMVHRLIRCSRMHFVTKGDNSYQVDGFIRSHDIIGVVSKVERDGRRIFFGLGPERIVIALLSRLGVLYLALQMWRLLRTGVKRCLGIKAQA